jgi:inosine-uridine nucleoside N-ribohydrolase
MLRRVKLPFLIDTDTASDDAVALTMALRSPQIQVLAITTVYLITFRKPHYR